MGAINPGEPCPQTLDEGKGIDLTIVLDMMGQGTLPCSPPQEVSGDLRSRIVDTLGMIQTVGISLSEILQDMDGDRHEFQRGPAECDEIQRGQASMEGPATGSCPNGPGGSSSFPEGETSDGSSSSTGSPSSGSGSSSPRTGPPNASPATGEPSDDEEEDATPSLKNVLKRGRQ